MTWIVVGAALVGATLPVWANSAPPVTPRGDRAPAVPAAPERGGTSATQDAGRTTASTSEKIRYGITPALPRKAGTLRLASYNVENLFDHADDPALSGQYDDAKMATADARCKALAAAIRAVDADVVALQEVESLDALRWFRDTYLPDMKYDHLAAHDVGYYRGVEQSVMSRFPIVRQQTWPDADLAATTAQRTGEGWTAPREGEGQRYQRSPLFAQVRTPDGYLLDLFVVHHKAGGKDFAFHRESEALQTIAFVKARLAEDPNARIAVLGDFNAAPSEQSVKIYRDPAFGGLQNAWDERFDRNRPRDTYVTHASGRVIDYILMSNALREDVVPKSFFVFGTPTPPEGWDWRTDKHPDDYASDHRPLVVDIVPRLDGPHAPATETKLWGAVSAAPAAPATPAAAPAPPATKE